jgi:vacuolar-type H+-ATPase subunit E/Vma4
MATTTISGTNKLAERIITDAQAEARAVLQEAQAAALAIHQESEKAVAARRAELLSQKESASKSLISGYRTRALLDGKKEALFQKRAVIDDAFTKAYAALLSLDAQKRESICLGMLRANAEGGETVLPAASDRAALSSLIKALPEKKLTLSSENAAIDGGFILLGEGYEKDCSFRSLLSTVRDAEETAVYQLLFT